MIEQDTPLLPANLSLQALQQHLQRDPAYSVYAALPLLELRILLCHALQLSRNGLITQDQQIITPTQADAIRQLFTRRLQGEPIAYIVGEREFFGLKLRVTPAVLIPRADTETLVELILQLAPTNASMLDMGTGSGAIAIACAHSRADLAVWALDVSAAALAIAQENANRHLGARTASMHFLQSDWFAALPTGQQFDLIASNPPYIEQHDPHLSQGDLRFEPRDALTDHADGLQDIRHIVQGAPAHLLAGGWLLLEHGYDQSAKVRALLQQQGWQEVQSWPDLAGIARVSGGRRPP